MWLKWLPWRYIVRHVARAQGFIDPILLLSRLRGFAQPSEVGAPLELLRAGVVFHARGLINTGAIQHNLDWVWPYWIERQFDPKDDAFIPRAFSITHVNLSHRNWTAVGLPDCDSLPIVDPRGLVTPFWDGWSLDAWIITDDGRELIPSQAASSLQSLDISNAISVVTETRTQTLSLISRTDVTLENSVPVCRQQLTATADCRAWLVVTVRPYNPEGVSFIRDVMLDANKQAWKINDRHCVQFSAAADRHQFSYYRHGDVRVGLLKTCEEDRVTCNVGMATAAALFELRPNEPRRITVSIPLADEVVKKPVATAHHLHPTWTAALEGHTRLSIPDEQFQFLYDAALRTLILHSPEDVYAGPYTYKRFWFRDAAFILHAMLCAGLTDRVERALDRFDGRQTRNGYFLSQDGEWDSNGEALWIMHRYCELSGRQLKPALLKSVRNGAHWIIRKRLSDKLEFAHAGLLPAGFSAEHLGPNDYYYWDDFWSIAGLQCAAGFMEKFGEQSSAAEFRTGADDLAVAIERSLQATEQRRDRAGIPASPYRRMDGGAIGSLAAGYPLQLWAPNDRRLLDTANFLIDECFVDGGFFQDMIHSGINLYLTLHVAQVLLRAGDPRALDLMNTVAGLASPTGQWPEAIHPRTLGGCMGDGQHVWAAAEWVMMMRNCFVREEADTLILVSGIPTRWLATGKPVSFGPAPTSFGNISITLRSNTQSIEIGWEAAWRGAEPLLEIRLPGFTNLSVPPGQCSVILSKAYAL
ncbi:MAG: hypothetical protein ABIR48_04120 [Gammaproteobacteria bacterium]